MADIPPPPPGTPPGPPKYTPPPMAPPNQPPAPSYSDYPPVPPPGAPGYGAPPAGYPNLTPGVNIMSQFNGAAGSSIVLGLLSVGIPIVTALISNGSRYSITYIIPIGGIYYGIRAARRGQIIGGLAGIVLSLIGVVITVTRLMNH